MSARPASAAARVAAEGVGAVAVAGLVLVEGLSRQGAIAPLPLVLAAAGAAAIPLARRLLPAAVAWLVAVSVLLHLLRDAGPPAALLLAVSYVTLVAGLRLPALPGGLAVLALVLASAGTEYGLGVPILIAAAVPWALGLAVARRRRLVAGLEERGREIADERDRVAHLGAQRARMRLAADLHDIVGHHLTAAVVQAGAGRMVEAGGAGAGGHRAAVARAVADARADLERLVTALDEDPAPAGPGAGADLVARVSALAGPLGAGVTIAPGVAADAQQAARIERVVREGLTNTMRHAPGASVEVSVAPAPEADGTLLVRVANGPAGGGPAPASVPAGGLGLAMLRRDLAASGERLHAGPDGQGGWVVEAVLAAACAPPVAAPAG